MNAPQYLTLAAGILLVLAAILQVKADWRTSLIVALFGIVNILVATAPGVTCS